MEITRERIRRKVRRISLTITEVIANIRKLQILKNGTTDDEDERALSDDEEALAEALEREKVVWGGRNTAVPVILISSGAEPAASTVVTNSQVIANGVSSEAPKTSPLVATNPHSALATEAMPASSAVIAGSEEQLRSEAEGVNTSGAKAGDT